jgi:adenylosuccinate synthase
MVYVSPFASIITEAAEEREQALMSGSTKEGVGATRALKCVRQAPIVGDTQDPRFNLHSQRELGFEIVEDGQVGGFLQRNDKRILLEATQGFGLSLNYKHYPFCTSTDLTPYQLLQDAEMPFGVHNVEVWMVVRTFPIRIAGNSGYLKDEISWEKLQLKYGSHIPVEQTTVTQKTRRVGEFDYDLVKDAIRQCRPNKIVLTFFDYLFPTVTEPISEEQDKWLLGLESKMGAKISYLGVGIGKVISRNGKN